MNKTSWLSLSLLLMAYASFSWFLYHSTAPRLVWLLALGFALGQALLLTALSKGLRTAINNWLESDVGYFSAVLLGAFSIAILLVWIHVLEYFLVLIGAELLARLDLQNAGFNQWQALGVLTTISLVGLTIGWAVSRYVIAS